MKTLIDNVRVVMLDIDGTIKDLAKENTEALIHTMKVMDRVDTKIRGQFVLWINKIVIYFIKTGLLPTNNFMQRILLVIYSVLLLKKYSDFKEIYFKKYNSEHIFFSGVSKKLADFQSKGKKVYLVTKNTQNKNILKFLKMNYGIKLIVANQKESKYYMYNHIIEELKVDKNSTVIIGDNLWDDVIPALVLGVNVIWCNMYDCKFKQFVINILSAINKKLLSCDNFRKI